MEEARWSREDLFAFCMVNADEAWCGDLHDYRKALEDMSDAELDAEADWLFEMSLK